jgi:ABC-type transport system involved in multi-copper enzyme maturation permease subunit
MGSESLRIIWILFFCGLKALLLYYGTSEWIDRVALFFATVLLTESVMSTLGLLYLSLFKHKESGDAYNFRNYTHPALFGHAAS